MIEMPQKFDSNEWFILGSLLLFYPIIFILAKRFPLSITLLVLAFGLCFSKLLDDILAPPPLDLYDINDTPKYDLADIFMWFLYPPFGYLYVYFYDKWRIRRVFTFLYIMACSFVSIGYEFLCLKSNLFIYEKGWKIIYSYPCYLALLSLHLMFFNYLKYQYDKTKLEKKAS